MKLHRPSAVMSNARDNILIVEREHIYVTEPDGRLIQTISHPSIKQLYGLYLFSTAKSTISLVTRYCFVS